ncbi:MAG: porin [Bacteroidetes bacterium]|nr:porin [Bacteroidota bacterium]
MSKSIISLTMTMIMMVSLPAIHAQDTLEVINTTPSHNIQDPGHPIIVLRSAGQKYQIGIGGFARLVGIYDLNGLQDVDDFITYQIPVGEKNKKDRMYLSASQSRLFTEFMGNTKNGPIRVYIEADFDGNGNAFRLRHAYGEYWGFLFGQTWTTFMDIDASPNTIDFEGPNSQVSLRNPMIRYGKKIGKHFSFAVSAETPMASITVAPGIESVPQYFPDLAGKIRIDGEWGHLQFAAILRHIAYEDSLSGKTRRTRSWGRSITGLINVTQNDIIMFQVVYGEGIARYIQDISGCGMDLVPAKGDSTLKPLPVWGFYGSVQHNWTPTINSSIIYGYTQAAKFGIQPDDYYKIGQYIAANFFWDILPVFTVGIEYLWGQRINQNGAKGTANRIDFMAQFTF